MKALLHARARIYHGVDLGEIAPDRIRDEGARVVVVLPPPT